MSQPKPSDFIKNPFFYIQIAAIILGLIVPRFFNPPVSGYLKIFFVIIFLIASFFAFSSAIKTAKGREFKPTRPSD